MLEPRTQEVEPFARVTWDKTCSGFTRLYNSINKRSSELSRLVFSDRAAILEAIFANWTLRLFFCSFLCVFYDSVYYPIGGHGA